ncbi:MAG TPA: hypothetical protein VJS92_11250 [Candidatus Polarisedimenticolaceae bacterium]|nr:hypothetical protein [Candidatus Polarisedimenticolaceae bacterium]
MIHNIRLLEERVAQAVGRLRELEEERRSLRAEVASLREQLAAAGEAAASAAARLPVWQAEREQVATALREVLGELRGE